MQGTLRIGRLGGLAIYLNYTWIFASVLVLWWVALLWLPENFPIWGTTFYWLVAVAVLLLYSLSVIAHEMVHSAFSGIKERVANLFPFGAAVPFRLQDVSPFRGLLAALAAPIFNLVLGGLLLFLGGMIPNPEHVLGWLKAILIPLGWLNVWLGAVNLIPGIPFDGGLALAAGHYSFSGDREGGMSLAQAMGRVATLMLVLLGAWRGLTSDVWLQALALIVVGWSAKEAAAMGQHRRTLRSVLSQMKAADFMDVTAPREVVKETDSVADLVRAHPRRPPNSPLPVLNATGDLVGVITLAATERLLQGTWPSTPVRALATPIGKLYPVSPYTPLVEVLAAAHARYSDDGNSEPAEEPAIPVVEGNKMLGSIDPARLQSLEEAGREFGVEEALGSDTEERKRGPLSRLGALLPAIMVLVAMAILGNIALHTDPLDLQEASAGTDSIVFSNFRPADGDIVGFGEQNLRVQVEGASAIISATIMVDGRTLDTQLSGSSPLTQTASARISGLTIGQHTARINAVTERGERKNRQWRFRVDSSVPAVSGDVTPPPGPTPTAGAVEPVQVSRHRPALGGRVPAGLDDVILSMDVKAAEPPRSAQILLDGQELDTTTEPIAGAEGLYRVAATAPPPGAGLHLVRVEVIGSGGASHSDSWTFSALQSDANNAYFKETGYFVTQPFLSYWQENGGLGLFGYPISDLVQETDKATGEVYMAQYFERARFEQHPSLGNQVLLGRLGALVQEPEPPAQPTPGAQYFPETGHNVSPTFLKFWNERGGLAVFGYPITEERMEKNPIDGKEYTVQYFERNRFELHPEKAGTPYEVQLGLLGTELYRQKYGP